VRRIDVFTHRFVYCSRITLTAITGLSPTNTAIRDLKSFIDVLWLYGTRRSDSYIRKLSDPARSQVNLVSTFTPCLWWNLILSWHYVYAFQVVPNREIPWSFWIHISFPLHAICPLISFPLVYITRLFTVREEQITALLTACRKFVLLSCYYLVC